MPPNHSPLASSGSPKLENVARVSKEVRTPRSARQLANRVWPERPILRLSSLFSKMGLDFGRVFN